MSACEPLGYLASLGLMRDAKVVITDSGGMQEETTALGVPCVTVRENTERPVTIEEGTQHADRRGPCGDDRGGRGHLARRRQARPQAAAMGRARGGADRGGMSDVFAGAAGVGPSAPTSAPRAAAVVADDQAGDVHRFEIRQCEALQASQIGIAPACVGRADQPAALAIVR